MKAARSSFGILAVVIVVLGCGRVGFDATEDAGSAADAGRDSGPGDGGPRGDAIVVGDAIVADGAPLPDGAILGCPVRADVVDVSAGAFSTCAVRADGVLSCWGFASEGELGLGPDIREAPTPTVVSFRVGFQRLARGARVNHCAVGTDDALYCWGTNAQFALGLGDDVPRYAPTLVQSGVATASLGTCSVSLTNALSCWGINAAGQVGDGTTEPKSTPTLVPGLSVSQVDSGQTTCAIDDSGQLWCWGRNDDGQCGLGHTNPVLTPQLVDAGGWVDVVTSPRATCAIDAAADLYCWGNNSLGQLGVGGLVAGVTVPTRVPIPGPEWKSLSSGTWVFCGVRTDGSLWCWGEGVFGSIGDGTTELRDVPTQVTGAATWTLVAVGTEHTCGLLGGQLSCWGDNGANQLGFDTGFEPQLTPRRVCLPSEL